MNEEHIDTQNEIVAQQVLGWKRMEGGWWSGRDANGVIFTTWSVPAFSQSMAEAWLVVEHMVRQGFKLHLKIGPNRSLAHFKDLIHGSRSFRTGEDDTPPAICRAAIEACAARAQVEAMRGEPRRGEEAPVVSKGLVQARGRTPDRAPTAHGH